MWFKLGRKSSSDGEPDSGSFGPYYLRELINSGGMADLWLATDEEKNTFALRRLHDNLVSDSTARKRFVQGCEVLAALPKNPGIIGYYAHGKIHGTPYLLMEYVEGANLKELYARHDEVLLENVANILIDMASALEHVHDSGYMHLDYKPENILVSRNANVKLVDFDLAQPRPKEPEKLAKNPGTPAYMSPEQLRGEPVDHRADIFAFGVSAYEMLTNNKPFPGDTPEEIVRAQLDRAKFVLPREHNPDLPPALEKTIMKCLETDPEKRPFFMSLVTGELKAALYVS